MATTPLATLEDVADVVGTIPAEDEARIGRLIDKVSARVRRYTGHGFQIGTVAGQVSIVHPHDGIARLPLWPVTAVSSVLAANTPVAVGRFEWTLNGFLKPTAPAWSYISQVGAPFDVDEPYNPSGASLDWGWPSAPLTVTYDYGYDEVPADVAGVVAEVVGAKYLGGALGLQSRSESIDGYAYEDRYQSSTVGAGGAWSAEHKAILDGYRRSGLVSLRLTT